MAHVLRPLCVLLLLLLALFTNYRAIAEPTLLRNHILNIRDNIGKDTIKDIWLNQYKSAVKNVDPSLLRAKKRGRRSGIKVRLQHGNTQLPLPGFILLNAQSILPKIDELFALVKHKSMDKLTQMICITETWLSDKISHSQTALDGYAQFRNDRNVALTGKTIGGGLLVYIDETWSKNNEIIFDHAENSLEMLTIKCRPKWLPREFQSVIIISCYCPFTGNAKLASVARETGNTIISHVSKIEDDYPNSAIMLMGDFNQQPLYMPSHYRQIVTKPTRNNKIIDKCYINVKNSYNYCKQLGKLGSSDHNIMQLLPSYQHKAKRQPVITTKRDYSDEHVQKLQDCLAATEWSQFIDIDDHIDDQIDTFNGYIEFCTDMHIPITTHKWYANNKPWVTEDILDLVKQKHHAYTSGNLKLSNVLKKRIEREIARSKRKYTQNISEHLAKEPSNAWNDIKKLGGLANNDKQTNQPINADPDELNKFFTRFEKSTPPTRETPPPPSAPSSTLKIQEDEVRVLLKKLDGRKGPGPDKLIPKILKLCADQLAPIITRLFSSSVQQQTTPTIWKTAIIKPLPKIAKPTCNKDFRPIAITSCLSKLLEKLIKRYVTSVTPLDDYQFAYTPRRSCQDAVLCLLTHVSEFIDRRDYHHARCLFLDFSSAFNTINVDILMQRLTHLDIYVYNWIYSFLTARPQFTSTNKLSSKLITYTGTPQGTVLSPVLFSIYTEFICASFPNTVVIKYADDTVIVGLISDHADFLNYQAEITKIQQLCTANDLLLNPTKTHEMLFSSKREKPLVQPVLIDGTAISFSDSVVYLGVTIDNGLKFSEQAVKASNKARQKIYLVKRFMKYGASPTLTKQLFNSFIESYLFYCVLAFYQHLDKPAKTTLMRPHDIFINLGMHHPTFISVFNQRATNFMLSIYHDESHFIHRFLHRMPSGRLRGYRHRCSIGRDCFLRHFILFINKTIFQR